jgi:hypothetical protein
MFLNLCKAEIILVSSVYACKVLVAMWVDMWEENTL